MELPRGTVTMVFTDVEGSTRLLHELGTEVYVRALEEHRRLLREAVTAHGGVEVEMQGDSFHFAFGDARAAVEAAAEAQRALAEHLWEAEPIRVRIGMHTGHPHVNGGLYAGADVHRAARVMSAGHGGQILVSEATRALLGDELTLRDLGRHRLKDLLAPLRLYQLGNEEFPQLNALYQTNLPVPPTPFLGRERELAELAALLADRAHRLVTLTGPGGTGKSRLAVQAAAEAAGLYPDGVYWVALAALRDLELVVPAIAHAVDARGDLTAELGTRRALLVLDNFEQLVAAAPKLAELLAACPSVTLLVTSRERLHLTGEHEYPIAPLQEHDSVVLFHERARAAGTTIDANGEIAEICRRLDQLPLAIELAAARVKALPPKTLLARLGQRLPLLTGGARDLPERQQTLRATIAWSYDLLTVDEQQLFARLSVFAGGCTLDGAEQVCDAQLDTLQSLLDKNLLRRTDDRYWMLETIREYAAERLDESGESAQIRQRQAEAIIALAEEAETRLRGSDARVCLEALERELGNVRAALGFMGETGQVDERRAVFVHTQVFWYVTGRWVEGLRWLEPALARSDPGESRLRGRALHVAAAFAGYCGDHGRVVEYAEEALTIFRELDDAEHVARALELLGLAAAEEGRYGEAALSYEEALDAAREIEQRSSTVAEIIGNLGDLSMKVADYERALSLTKEALDIYRELGRDQMVGWGLHNLALCLLRTDRLEQSLAAARECLSVGHSIGDVETLSTGYGVAGALAATRGHAEAGANLLGVADALRARFAVRPFSGAEAQLNVETVESLQQTLGDDRYEAALARGREMSLEDALNYAMQALREDG